MVVLQVLLLESKAGITISPPGVERSESSAHITDIWNMHNFWRRARGKIPLQEYERGGEKQTTAAERVKQHKQLQVEAAEINMQLMVLGFFSNVIGGSFDQLKCT